MGFGKVCGSKYFAKENASRERKKSAYLQIQIIRNCSVKTVMARVSPIPFYKLVPETVEMLNKFKALLHFYV